VKTDEKQTESIEDLPFPYLCGGIFFSLVLEALKVRTAPRKTFDNSSDGRSKPEVLAAIIEVMYPGFMEKVLKNKVNENKTFKPNTTAYRACTVSNGTYLPFDMHSVATAFDRTIKNDYTQALRRMADFVDSFIETDENLKKDEWLVKALLELVEKDTTISNEPFYCCEDGTFVTKQELLTAVDYSLPAFLLGIWHFIVLLRPDNNIGRRTFLKWHKQRGETGSEWDFKFHKLGTGITLPINVYMPEIHESPAPIDAEPVIIKPAETDISEKESNAVPSDDSPMQSEKETAVDADPKRITVNNYGTVENQKFVSIETMNGDLHL